MPPGWSGGRGPAQAQGPQSILEAGGLEEPGEWPRHSRNGWGTTAQVSVSPSLPVGDRERPTSSPGQESQPCLHTHHCPSPLSAVGLPPSQAPTTRGHATAPASLPTSNTQSHLSDALAALLQAAQPGSQHLSQRLDLVLSCLVTTQPVRSGQAASRTPC